MNPILETVQPFLSLIEPVSSNLASKAGVGYTYGDTTHDHAVTLVDDDSNVSSKTITIRAKKFNANGVTTHPLMQLYIDGQQVASWLVTGRSSYANYTTTQTISNNEEIAVLCSNCSQYIWLDIDYVTVGSQTVQAEGPATLLDLGVDEEAFDWLNVSKPAFAVLVEPGAMRFVVGNNAFAGKYDANGNLVYRLVNGLATIMTYDAGNRLVSLSGGATASFVYNGDDERVQSIVNGLTTTYVNSSYEVSGGVSTSYYFAEGQRIAMRKSGVVSYLLPDHLGSTMLTTGSSGVKTAEQWYKAWGEVRYSSGSLQTKYTYTGQYSNTSDFGLMYYNARWYDPLLSRFAQADTVIPQPGNPQDWNRYSYVKNSPANYTDPSGHMVACGTDAGNGCAGFGPHEIINAGYDTEKADSLLRSFFETHPEYVVEMDPLIYGQNEEFIVRTVLFQVEVGRMPSFDERLQIELEKPMYEPLLANQYTPVVTSAMSVLATDAQYLSLAIPHPAQPLTFGLSYLLGRATGLVSLASTSYQYKHNLYGTTKTDAEIAAATTLVGAIPKPDMAIMVHVGFFYTVLRTFGAIPSP